MKLEDIRVHIDSVDRELKQLIEKRMELAYEVAMSKLESDDCIYKPDREKVIISTLTANTRPEFVKEYTALIKKIMLVSREYQYTITMENKNSSPVEYVNMADSTKIHEHSINDNTDNPIILSCNDTAVPAENKQVIQTESYIHELLKILSADKRYIAGFKTENGGLTIQSSPELVGNSRTDHLLLYINSPDYTGMLTNILNIIADFDVPVSWIRTMSDCCYIELETNITRTLTKAMVYMMLSEYDNIYVAGSYSGSFNRV